MRNNTIGVILAGGKSSRMGGDKVLLKLEGRPLIEHVAATLQGVFSRIVLVTNDDSDYRFLGLETVGDIYKECGPLGGIHSALSQAGGADIFVSACDTPLISRELVRHVAEFPSPAPAIIPRMKQRLHPLCGLYTSRCLQPVTEQLDAGRYRVLDFVEEIGAAIVPITPDLPFYREDLFSNFNTPEDTVRNMARH